MFSALMMALRLNERILIRCVVENIPCADSKLTIYYYVINNRSVYKLTVRFISVELTVANLTDVYVEKVLKFIALELESSRHIHFYFLWIEIILTKHGQRLNSALQMPILLMLQKNMQKKYDDLSKMLVILHFYLMITYS